MGKCSLCHISHPTISSFLSICLNCIRKRPEEALEIAQKRRASARLKFGLPPSPLRNPNGIKCNGCANSCSIGIGEIGFCGLVKNIEGRLIRLGGSPDRGILEWYYDPLPTNCVASWFCPGCTGRGYPKYSYSQGPEIFHENLAVFYGSCSYDCLYCQNWHFRKLTVGLKSFISAKDLAAKAEKKSVSCICYFGGDPSTQMPHCLETSKIALEKAKESNRILRLCWETNGNISEDFIPMMGEYALESGGNIKFDIKSWDENLNIILCGTSNRSSLNNLKLLGKFYEKRLEVPLISVSTLLVPGYIDVEEVRNIAEFISSIDRSIPYTLLGFYGCFFMEDLPRTSRSLALKCKEVALKYLDNVSIGNIWLLS
ncbi:MAG: radical SAM protein [Candidatus Methanomethyliaceae archaeon]|nr:radical SAM protein [Candidatus Methanomethyliaceae archaeon]